MRTKKAQQKNDQSKKGFLGNYWQYNNWTDKEDLQRYIQSFSDNAEGYRRRNSEEMPNSYERFDAGSDWYGQRSA